METSSVTGEHSPRHPSSQRRHALGGCSWERGWGDGDHWTVTIWGILTHPKHHRWLVYHILSRRHFFKITVCNVFFSFLGLGGLKYGDLTHNHGEACYQPSWWVVPVSSSYIYIYILHTYIYIYIHRGSWHRRWSNTHYFHRVLQPSDSPCSNSFLHSPCPPFQHLSVAVPFLSWPEFTAEASHCPPISPLTYFRRFFLHSFYLHFTMVRTHSNNTPPPVWSSGTIQRDTSTSYFL